MGYLAERLDTLVDNPNILLDCYQLPSDSCLALMASIVEGTAFIVSDISFNHVSSVKPTGTSAVVLAPSVDYDIQLYAKGSNWATGSHKDQSAYCSKLAGVILALTILDVLVCQ